MSSIDLLIVTALTVVMLVSVALLIAGIGLLLRGLSGRRPSESAPEPSLALLDRQWHIERLLYRHHRITGLVIIGAAAYFLWQTFHRELLGHIAVDWQPAWWLLVAGSGINLIIGSIIILRPSGLKPVESMANRWFPLDTRKLVVWLNARPGLRGVLILITALLALIAAATLLLERIGISAIPA